MRQQDVFKKIGSILQELNEQYDYLKNQDEEINDLELELFAANSHFLSDHLEIFRKLNAQPLKSLPVHDATLEDIPVIPEKEEEAQNEPLFQPYKQTEAEVDSAAVELMPTMAETTTSPASHFEIEQPGEESPGKNESNFKFDFSPFTDEEIEGQNLEQEQSEKKPRHEVNIYDQIAVNAARADTEGSPHQMDMSADTGHDHYGYVRAAEPETAGHDLVLDEADTFEEDKPGYAVQEETEEEGHGAEDLAAVEITPEPEASADTPSGQTPAATEPEKPLTLNERIAAQTGVQSSGINSAPVKDLKSAITLNDKLLFVRDLFNGYSLAYSEAVEILNRFNNYEDADRFLSTNYVAKNNWESKPETKEKFYDLLKRRYA